MLFRSGAGNGVAAIGGLNEGEALFPVFSADGFGPLEVSIGIQLDDIDIEFSCAGRDGDAGDSVATIGGLNEGNARMRAYSADGFGPLEVPIGIQLDDIDIDYHCAEGFGSAGDGVSTIGGLNEGEAQVFVFSADSSRPLEVSMGIQLDDIDIGSSCAKGFSGAGDGVAAIGGLNEELALIAGCSADSLTEGRGGSVARTLCQQRGGDKKR